MHNESIKKIQNIETKIVAKKTFFYEHVCQVIVFSTYRTVLIMQLIIYSTESTISHITTLGGISTTRRLDINLMA